MTFTARVIRHSQIWRMWRQHHRTGGEICGVLFRWATGDDYVSTAALSAEQIAQLRTVSSVRLEAYGSPSPVPARAAEPAPEVPSTVIPAVKPVSYNVTPPRPGYTPPAAPPRQQQQGAQRRRVN